MAGHPIVNLSESLRPYAPCDLLTSAAGLQLMPENADQALRLEALAHAIASLPLEMSKPNISGSRFRAICNSPPLGSVAPMEDPFPNPFTEAVAFHGGNFVVFPGVIEDAAFIFRHIARGLFLAPQAFPSEDFIVQGRSIILGVLALSNEIARRIGIPRGLSPVARHMDPLVIPASQKLAILKDAVSFNHTHLSRVFGRLRVDPTALAILTTDFGAYDASQFQPSSGLLSTTPIVRTPDRWIIALPGSLLSASWTALIRLAHALGVRPALAEYFHESVWGSARESLESLGHRPIPSPMPDALAASCVREGFFSLDSDKLLHVILVTDFLDAYDPAEPFGEWPIGTVRDQVLGRIRRVREHLRSLDQPPSEVLSLFLTEGVGRGFVTGLDHPDGYESLRLYMAVANLETITMLEGRNPLLLLKYARAVDRLLDRSKVICFSELDRFALYRENDHCFYLGDDRRPDLLNISTDMGGHLRCEVARKFDWHAAVSFDPGRYTEVAALHGTSGVPLYISRRILGTRTRRPAILVEGYTHPIWIIGPPYEDDASLVGDGNIPFVFASAVAYWLWQMTPSLSDDVQAIVTLSPVIVELTFDGDFMDGPDDNVERDGPVASVTIDQAATSVMVSVNRTIGRYLNRADNSGERALMIHVLEGIRQLLPHQDRPRLSDQVISQYVERHAPLGQKKMILLLRSSVTPSLDLSGLPPYRAVQSADENNLWDELGTHLSEVKGLTLGPIPDFQINGTFKECVSYFYKAFSDLVSSLDPTGLLEWLVSFHETLVYEVESTRMTIPTRLACFSDVVEMSSMLSKELPERFKASVSARFLIEFVTAQPPKGNRPMSLEIYDRLLALASEIVDFGQFSDLVQYNLAKVEISMLSSGRLGIGRDQYDKARRSFLPVQARGEIGRAIRSHHRYWRQPDSNPNRSDPAPFTEFDKASRAEFGFTLTEFSQFCSEILTISRSLDPVVCRLPLGDLLDRLRAELEWPGELTSQMLDMLTLNPRPDFLCPQKPYQREDVYPWRYNRALSYIRRPFLLRDTKGGPEILWGPRQIYASHQNLFGLCTSGRLRAKSLEMKQFASRLLNEQGEIFNDAVADLLALDQKLMVRRRLKKIPALRGQLEKLGDVDVFVIDQSKRRVHVVECKDLEGARTPFEMSNELTNFFKGSGGKPSIVAKHQRRVDWIRDNLDEVLRSFGIERTGNWRVGSMIVIDRELFTPFLHASPVPIVPMEQLRDVPASEIGKFISKHI
ncbi:hypothetical protein [Tautonia rosea]|uniref:hypothetical protein n=1 Tax=Tautonia rosea TaxID=2728037 RepID=UPI0014763450|nr:hypothetical protein [Tautonia rosea]